MGQTLDLGSTTTLSRYSLSNSFTSRSMSTQKLSDAFLSCFSDIMLNAKLARGRSLPGFELLQVKRVNYDPALMKFLPNRNFTLRWWTNSFLYFDHCKEDLYKLFRFDENLQQKCSTYLEDQQKIFIESKKYVSGNAHQRIPFVCIGGRVHCITYFRLMLQMFPSLVCMLEEVTNYSERMAKFTDCQMCLIFSLLWII